MVDLRCPHCETEIDEHEANKCLDVWVAKEVMGIEIRQEAGGVPYYLHRKGFSIPPKLYSTNIAAAWEVVERVGQDNSTHLIWYNAEERSPYFIAAFGFGKKVEAKADTMSLAICRAALTEAIRRGEKR